MVYVQPGKVEWREAPTPRLQGAGEALVEPVSSSRCDFDRFIVSGGTPFDGPFAIGHEALVRVVECGDAVRGFAPGDLASIPPTISCGECRRCQRGLNAYCSRVPPASAFGVGAGFGGLYDDLVRVPYADAMLVPVPAGLNPADLAAAGDSTSMGHTIMSAAHTRGAKRVMVLGGGEHGLFQVAFAHLLLDPEVLVYIDTDAERRRTAHELGATSVHDSPPGSSVGPLDLLVDAACNRDWLHQTILLVEPDGVVECTGGYFGDLALPSFPMYVAGTQIRFGQANTLAHIGPTLEVIASGRLKPSAVWANHVSWSELPAAYVEQSGKLIATR
ncbi:hypothetical protein AWC06_21445 [Mycobacterium fragae]|uniref:Alcohol dehydrogenase-like N-terminal domain-containing protein n=1 Tax=Mycobacterium fragae TaxID=1260918 RepID=A0A1X1UN54_9MYCO|nr:hypothetical protein AWC06_21445 [Mycobacterium fragae]